MIKIGQKYLAHLKQLERGYNYYGTEIIVLERDGIFLKISHIANLLGVERGGVQRFPVEEESVQIINESEISSLIEMVE